MKSRRFFPAYLFRRRSGAPTRVKPATLAQMEDRLDGLLATRLRHLKTLPADIAASFWAANTKTANKLVIAWCRSVGLLNIPSAFFDIGVVPHAQLRIVLIFRCIITVTFLGSAAYVQWRRRHAGWCVLLPTAAMVAMACIDGFLSHSGEVFVYHMTMGVMVASTAIIFLPLRAVETAWLTASIIAILGGMLCIAPLASWVEKAQMMTFYGSVLWALMEARFVQNRYQYRLFLLQARDELRASQITQRNKQLSSIAYIDRLTNIPNRRYFDEFAETVNRTPDLFLPLCVCLLDIDHFKCLNDRLGHLQGDRYLATVAGAIREALRAETDILVRFGGEEFVLLLPRTSLASALEVAERVRLAVQALQLAHPGTERGHVTVSAGVALMTGATPLETALQAADEAMYRAKQGGRNRVSE